MLLLVAAAAPEDPKKNASGRGTLKHHARDLDGGVRDVQDAGEEPADEDSRDQENEPDPNERVTAIPNDHLWAPQLAAATDDHTVYRRMRVERYPFFAGEVSELFRENEVKWRIGNGVARCNWPRGQLGHSG